jgi:DNA mismatch endonuclease (patch repair protein)
MRSVQDIRSKNMAAVKAVNTSPEIHVRKLLHAQGFRYSLHNKNLPGKPDITLKKYKAVIFVEGCFWHGHDCPRFSWPKTRVDFWRNKIEGNVERDERNHNTLLNMGWRVGRVWECALKGKTKRPLDEIQTELYNWLNSDENEMVVKGRH